MNHDGHEEHDGGIADFGLVMALAKGLRRPTLRVGLLPFLEIAPDSRSAC